MRKVGSLAWVFAAALALPVFVSAEEQPEAEKSAASPLEARQTQPKRILAPDSGLKSVVRDELKGVQGELRRTRLARAAGTNETSISRRRTLGLKRPPRPKSKDWLEREARQALIETNYNERVTMWRKTVGKDMPKFPEVDFLGYKLGAPYEKSFPGRKPRIKTQAQGLPMCDDSSVLGTLRCGFKFVLFHYAPCSTIIYDIRLERKLEKDQTDEQIYAEVRKTRDDLVAECALEVQGEAITNGRLAISMKKGNASFVLSHDKMKIELKGIYLHPQLDAEAEERYLGLLEGMPWFVQKDLHINGRSLGEVFDTNELATATSIRVTSRRESGEVHFAECLREGVFGFDGDLEFAVKDGKIASLTLSQSETVGQDTNLCELAVSRFLRHQVRILVETGFGSFVGKVGTNRAANVRRERFSPSECRYRQELAFRNCDLRLDVTARSYEGKVNIHSMVWVKQKPNSWHQMHFPSSFRSLQPAKDEKGRTLAVGEKGRVIQVAGIPCKVYETFDSRRVSGIFQDKDCYLYMRLSSNEVESAKKEVENIPNVRCLGFEFGSTEYANDPKFYTSDACAQNWRGDGRTYRSKMTRAPDKVLGVFESGVYSSTIDEGRLFAISFSKSYKTPAELSSDGMADAGRILQQFYAAYGDKVEFFVLSPEGLAQANANCSNCKESFRAGCKFMLDDRIEVVMLLMAQVYDHGGAYNTMSFRLRDKALGKRAQIVGFQQREKGVVR